MDPVENHPSTSVYAGIVADIEARFRRDDLRITVALPDDYPDVEALSRAADSREVMTPLTASLIEWFVDRNPCGQGFVVVARSQPADDIVGYFLFYPWPVRRRETGGAATLPAFLYVRLYVAATHRRKGIFAAMTSFGVLLLERIGVRLAYTVPNPRSTAGFLKFGMTSAGTLPFWVRPAIPGWGAVFRLLRPAKGFTIERRPAFDGAVDDLFEADLPERIRYWGRRTSRLLNWRYVAHPGATYEIRYLLNAGRFAGFLVTRRMRIKGLRSLVICDFWVPEALPGLLRAGVDDAMRAARPLHVVIAVGCGRGAPGRGALQRAGFILCPPVLLPQPVAVIGGGIGAPPNRVELPSTGEWHLTPYDWDVF
jgi:GNAT superfamily N-acetyltransferase